MEKTQKTNKMIDYIFLILLAIYPLRNIWLGVELTDGLYSAGNYRFPESINKMWFFSTYLANITGRLLTKLPFGNRLIGLRFYAALFICALAVFVYLFFTRVVKTEKWIGFVGVVLAESLCWAPVTILYHYMTYGFFDLIVIVLYLGLIKEKRSLMFLAGVLLGMNVWVRFPNLTEAALILSVWYYGWLMRKRFKDVMQETGICLLGFLSGIGVVFFGILLKYGLQEYIDGITMLMGIPSDASDYSPYAMVLSVLLDYKYSGKWLLHMVFLVASGCLVSALFYKAAGDRGNHKVIGLFGRVCFLGGIVLLFKWWYSLGVFNVKYYTYESMFQWTAVFLILTILAGFTVLFRKKSSRNEKLLASMILVFIAITPLGSNNHLYPNINNMFLVFPFGLAAFGKVLRWLCQMESIGLKGNKWKVSLYPAVAMLLLFFLATAAQCFLFGAVFTFRDGMSGQKRDTKIENNAVLKGIVTNAELAEAVEELTAYIEGEGLSGRELILYGDIPAVSYILDMPSAISTTWPDLKSYGYDVMAEDMEKVKRNLADGREPLVIYGAGLDAFIQGNIEDLPEEMQAAFEENQKFKMLVEFTKEEGYERVFMNGRFAVYQKGA